MAHEITISWDASSTPGATYNVYRGTALGNESPLPYATGIALPPAIALSSVVAAVSGVTSYVGTVTGGDNNAFLGMKVRVFGFVQSANNGTFVVASSDATHLNLVNGAGVTDGSSGTAQLRPYFIDTAVFVGKRYSYEITSVVMGIESQDSLELLSDPVPFPPSPAQVHLSLATSFLVLAGSTVTNTGTTNVGGDVGVSPGNSITGFGSPSAIAGAFHAADFVAGNAQNALSTAYVDAQSRSGAITIPADIGGLTFGPGVYNVASSLAITGSLTLDAAGDPNAVFIFQIGSTLTTAVNNSTINLVNGANADNVFWAVGSSATLNGGTKFSGVILAQSSISVGAGVDIDGALLARTGAVTLISDNIAMFITAFPIKYNHNQVVNVGQIFYDCGSQSYQQAMVGGVTGATSPTFSAVLGSTVHDGTVTWVTVNPLLTLDPPPSAPNAPPAAPAGPTNPAISSET